MKKSAFPNLPGQCALYALLAVLVFAPSRLAAHPHVWIDVVTDVLFDKKGRVTGLRHAWTFDDSYSVMALQGLDKNKDGKYSATELEPFTKKAIKSLEEWEYFSYIKRNGKAVPLRWNGKGSAHLQKGKLALKFDVMVKKPLDPLKNDIRLSVYDRSFYNLLSFAETDPVWLGKHAPRDCGYVMQPAKRGDGETTQVDDSYIESLGKEVNYGAQFAEWVKLDCTAQ